MQLPVGGVDDTPHLRLTRPNESQSSQSSHGSLTDEQLIALVDDAWAFAELFDRYYPRILNYAFRCTLNAATAEELTSGTFLKALQARRRFRPTVSFKAWIFQIATNEIRMHHRSRRRRREYFWPEAELRRIRFDSDPSALAAQKEEQLRAFARVHEAVEALSDRYREAIALRYFEGLSNDEIATTLGSKSGTIKSIVSRGLEKLRACLRDQTKENQS